MKNDEKRKELFSSKRKFYLQGASFNFSFSEFAILLSHIWEFLRGKHLFLFTRVWREKEISFRTFYSILHHCLCWGNIYFCFMYVEYMCGRVNFMKAGNKKNPVWIARHRFFRFVRKILSDSCLHSTVTSINFVTL